MFRRFKKPEAPVPTRVTPIEPREEPAYQIGVTESNRVTLRVGYSTLTMNALGVEHLIQMLQTASEITQSFEPATKHDGRGPG